jgi:hypothetical protein
MKELIRKIEQAALETEFSGVISIFRDASIMFSKAFGYRDIKNKLTETYLSTHSTFNDTNGYGCGIYKRLDDSMFWIEGGDAGVGFDSSHLPQEKLTINILSNITNGEEGMRDVVLSHF